MGLWTNESPTHPGLTFIEKLFCSRCQRAIIQVPQVSHHSPGLSPGFLGPPHNPETKGKIPVSSLSHHPIFPHPFSITFTSICPLNPSSSPQCTDHHTALSTPHSTTLCPHVTLTTLPTPDPSTSDPSNAPSAFPCTYLPPAVPHTSQPSAPSLPSPPVSPQCPCLLPVPQHHHPPTRTPSGPHTPHLSPSAPYLASGRRLPVRYCISPPWTHPHIPQGWHRCGQ